MSISTTILNYIIAAEPNPIAKFDIVQVDNEKMIVADAFPMAPPLYRLTVGRGYKSVAVVHTIVGTPVLNAGKV